MVAVAARLRHPSSAVLGFRATLSVLLCLYTLHQRTVEILFNDELVGYLQRVKKAKYIEFVGVVGQRGERICGLNW